MFRQYYPQVFRQLAYLLHDYSLAEDLAQDVFLRLYEHPPKNHGNLGGWLAQVARNLAFNQKRNDKNHRRKETEIVICGEAMTSSQEREWEIIEVGSILSEMPARDRSLLVLKHSGFTYEEIAVALSINKASVGTLLARAQQKFKKLYEEGEKHGILP